MPKYCGKKYFSYDGCNRKVDKLCLVCHSNDTDIIPLFSLAQAILLGDPTDEIKTVILLIAMDEDQQELSQNVRMHKNQIIPY